jgi:TonB family protein
MHIGQCRLAAAIATLMVMGACSDRTAHNTAPKVQKPATSPPATASIAPPPPVPSTSAEATNADSFPTGTPFPTGSPSGPTPSADLLLPGHSYEPIEAKPLRIGGDVKAPVSLERTAPDYQRCNTGKRIQVSGPALVEVVVDETGVVDAARILRSVEPCLDQAVLDAVKMWRFKPATLHGKPVASFYNLSIHIDLH